MELFDELPAGSPGGLADIHSAGQFAAEDLERLFALADRMRGLVDGRGGTDLLEYRLLATVFYEPSTRTASSFVAAMQRLGGEVIPLLQGAEATSAAKGESLRDTVRTLSGYADGIVLRHPEEGSAARAAEAATVPVLNAGDGTRQHPTQALLDVYTMADRLESLDDKKIVIAGDLKFGRTVHSLVRLLEETGADLEFVSPPSLQLPSEFVEALEEAGNSWETHDELGAVLGEADVVYMTRIQRERFDDPDDYDRVAGTYEIEAETMTRLSADALLMHPLPRVGEIHPEVDDDPRAVYFEQAENGMYVRMALLAEVLGTKNS